MNQTTFQPAEIYDSNGSIIQQGAYGINTPFCTSTGDGVYDYIVNNLNALKDMIAAGYIAVATLPPSGQTNKYYVIKEGANAGKCYVWTGSAWQELATQINGKSAYEIAVEHGFIGTEQQWLDSFTADAIAAADRAEAAMETIEAGLETLEGIDARFGNIEDHAKMTDSNVEATKKRISNVEKLLQGNLYDYQTDDTVAYEKTVPAGALPYAGIEQIGGKTVVWNQLVNSGATTVATISGHKYYTLINGTANIVTSSGSAITIVDDTADMVCDLTLMFGSGNEPSTTADFTAIFGATHYSYNAGTLLSAGVTGVKSVGKNLADISIVKAFYPSLVTIVSADEFTFMSSGSISATNRFFDNVKKRSDQITISYSIKYSDNASSGVYLRVYYTDGTFDRLYNNEANNQWKSVTWTSASNKIVDYIAWSYASGTVLATIKKLQIEWGTTATSYSPYKEISTPIPTAIQQLDGYGWSAGTAYNYIDYERKVFVQNVGSRAYASGDESNTAVTTDMTTTYYPLATPIETDISEYLTDDNLIEVGNGGTLTFKNNNGDNYHIPIPSTETYMIDLQEAISNG